VRDPDLLKVGQCRYDLIINTGRFPNRDTCPSSAKAGPQL